MMNKIEMCPICGSMPILEKEDMGRENGHGYPGSYAYSLSCRCQIMTGHGYGTTVYSGTESKAIDKAIETWNIAVEKVRNHIKSFNE